MALTRRDAVEPHLHLHVLGVRVRVQSVVFGVWCVNEWSVCVF